jgi:hypothetical protein
MFVDRQYDQPLRPSDSHVAKTEPGLWFQAKPLVDPDSSDHASTGTDNDRLPVLYRARRRKSPADIRHVRHDDRVRVTRKVRDALPQPISLSLHTHPASSGRRHQVRPTIAGSTAEPSAQSRERGMSGWLAPHDSGRTSSLVQLRHAEPRYAGFACLTCTDAPALSSSVPRAAISSPAFRSPNTSISGPDVNPVLTSTHSVRPSRTRMTNVRPVVLATLPCGTRSDGAWRRTGH